eukprot:366445-Chlamydomonas_euryale.AAC.2
MHAGPHLLITHPVPAAAAFACQHHDGHVARKERRRKAPPILSSALSPVLPSRSWPSRSAVTSPRFSAYSTRARQPGTAATGPGAAAGAAEAPEASSSPHAACSAVPAASVASATGAAGGGSSAAFASTPACRESSPGGCSNWITMSSTSARSCSRSGGDGLFGAPTWRADMHAATARGSYVQKSDTKWQLPTSGHMPVRASDMPVGVPPGVFVAPAPTGRKPA